MGDWKEKICRRTGAKRKWENVQKIKISIDNICFLEVLMLVLEKTQTFFRGIEKTKCLYENCFSFHNRDICACLRVLLQNDKRVPVRVSSNGSPLNYGSRKMNKPSKLKR